MTRLFHLLAVFTLLSAPAAAQDNPAASSGLFTGGWTLDGVGDSITIANPPFDEPQKFYLNCVALDAFDARFAVQDETRQFTLPLVEGSAAIIEGKTLHISQIAPGDVFTCTWDILETVETQKQVAPWNVKPDGQFVLLAAFAKPTRFVFGINRSNGCTDGVASLLVDGDIVMDITGGTLALREGSSFIGKGTVIGVAMSGSCDPATQVFSGSLDIVRVEPRD